MTELQYWLAVWPVSEPSPSITSTHGIIRTGTSAKCSARYAALSDTLRCSRLRGESSLNRSAPANGDVTIQSHVRRYTSPIARRCSASVTTMKLQFCTLADVGACTAISRHSQIRPVGTGLVKSRRLRTERVVVSSASVDKSTMG